jgi:hypothetical protein
LAAWLAPPLGEEPDLVGVEVDLGDRRPSTSTVPCSPVRLRETIRPWGRAWRFRAQSSGKGRRGGAATDEVVGQGATLVERPGLEGGDELALVNQAVLQGQQAEEEVAVGGEGGHGVGLLGGRR